MDELQVKGPDPVSVVAWDLAFDGVALGRGDPVPEVDDVVREPEGILEEPRGGEEAQLGSGDTRSQQRVSWQRRRPLRRKRILSARVPDPRPIVEPVRRPTRQRRQVGLDRSQESIGVRRKHRVVVPRVVLGEVGVSRGLPRPAVKQKFRPVHFETRLRGARFDTVPRGRGSKTLCTERARIAGCRTIWLEPSRSAAAF